MNAQFIKDISLHDAFRQARALTFLPRSPDLPLPDFLQKGKEREQPDVPVIDVRRTESESSSPTSSIKSLFPPTPTTPSQYSPTYLERRLDSHPEEAEEAESSTLAYYAPSPGGSWSVPSSYYTPYSPTLHSPYPSVTVGGYGPKHVVLSPPSPTITPRRYRSVSSPVPPPPSNSRRSAPPPPNRLSAPATPLPGAPRPAPTQPIPQSPYSSAASSAVSVVSPVSPAPQPYNDHCLRVPSPLPTPYSSEESISTITEVERYVPSDMHLSRDSMICSKIVTRADSPLHEIFADSCASTRSSLPPPYNISSETRRRRSVGPQLDRALKICGISPIVRQEILKCICSEPGYEPARWQTRLRDCNLNPDAVDFIIEEMCKELEGTTTGQAL